MPFIYDRVYYMDRGQERFDLPYLTMVESNVVIAPNFRILKNRFGPHTDKFYVELAKKYKYGDTHLDDNLFRME